MVMMQIFQIKNGILVTVPLFGVFSRILDGISDNHVDSTLLPLRPGKLLINPCKMSGKLQRLPPELRRWDILCCEDVDRSIYPSNEVLLASEHISVNLLSIDEQRVLVHDSSSGLIRSLERHGFTPIPLRLRHSRIFGGGFHCSILDVRRRETLARYL